MNFLDKYQNKILIFLWSVIFLTCLFVIFTEPVKASSDVGLPYTVENSLSKPLSYFEEVYKTTASNLGYSEGMINIGNWEADNIICYNYLDDGGFAYTYCLIPYFNNPSYTCSFTGSYENFNYRSNAVLISFQNYILLQFHSTDLDTWYYDDYSAGNRTVYFFGGNPYPSFISSDFYDTNNNIVLVSPKIDLNGHAQPPVDENGHYIDDGTGNRIPKPNKPTPTVYTPPSIQFPTVDTSSLEKLLESLIDLVQYGISYLGGVIGGWFSNLLSNLYSLFDYVVQSFNYAINNVVGSIKDLAQTIYNNFASLFENVATFFNNLIALGTIDGEFTLFNFFHNLLVPDSEVFAQSLLNGDIHHVVPLVQSVKSKFVSLFDSFSNLTPSKVLLIPSFTWHGQTINLSVDFSWYDDYKVYGDSIITGFLVIGYIYWFVLQLSSMFRGGNSIGHDVSKVGGNQ